MSTVTRPSRTSDRPGLGRLTAVELRKMTDTRAGFWLSLGVVLATTAVVILALLTGGPGGQNLHRVFRFALQPSAFLLPVIGILLVTGEFSQRTAMTTFSLVPSRSRVLVAKLGAALVVSVVALAVCLALSGAGVALAGGTWGLGAMMVPQALVFLACAMVTGVAFGAALLVSAPAIVAYLLIPIAWNALVNTIHSLDGVAAWLDQARTLGPLTEHMLTGTQWVRALVTLAVWMLIPLLIGARRLLRREVV